MKEKLLLPFLFFIVGILPVRAVSLLEVPAEKRDTIILKDSTGRVFMLLSQDPPAPEKAQEPAPTVGKKKKKFIRPSLIDREIMKTTFIPKGQWMGGGTVSYSEYDEENLNWLVLKDMDGLGYTLSISPYVGYFIKNNAAVGLRFTYNRNYLDLDNLELNLGEDFNINLDNLYLLEHKFEVGAFLRTYMPIGRTKIFGLFNELRLSYGYSRGKNSTGSGSEYDGTFQRINSFQIGTAPGLTAFVSDWAAVEVSLDVMGYSFKWTKQITNQVESGSKRSSSGNFRINLFSINIGMTIYL